MTKIHLKRVNYKLSRRDDRRTVDRARPRGLQRPWEKLCAARLGRKKTKFVDRRKLLLRPAGGDPGVDRQQKFFWRFVFLWENLALLNPIKCFWCRGTVFQETKNKEESCSFLDAIGRRSCGPLSALAKNRHVEKPKLRLKRIETAGRYATVRFITLLWLAIQPAFESRWSLLCIHIVGHATESEVHASGKFCSISDPPPPLSLSPCDHIREK